jgi:WD40 repeat protein
MRKAFIPILAVLLSFSVYLTARAELLGVSWSGELWSVDQETAEAVLLGVSDGYELNAFAVDPAGRLVTVDGDGRLIFVDPSSGEVEDVVWLDLRDTQVSVRALAFSPDGWLYAVNWALGSTLFAIDPETGQGTEIGMLDAYFTQSLDFSPDGVLFGWGRDQGLYTIDTSTAEIADVNPVAVGPFLQSIVFAPDGELLGVRNDRGVDGLIEEIYEIDPATGAAAPQAIGIRRDLRGLVFIP